MAGRWEAEGLFYKNNSHMGSVIANVTVLIIAQVVIIYLAVRLKEPLVMVLSLAGIAYAFFATGKEWGIGFSFFFIATTLLMLSLTQFKTAYFLMLAASVALMVFYVKETDEIEAMEKRNEARENELEKEMVVQQERLAKILAAIEANRERVENYRTLNEVAQKLTSTLEKEMISRTISGAIQSITGKSEVGFSLLVWDDETGMFASVDEKQGDRAQMKGTIKIYRNDPFDDWIIKNKFTLFIKNIEDDFRFKNLRKDWITFRSIIAIPLIENKKVIGILKFFSDVPDIFSNDDARLLNYLGDLCTAAVQNSILYQKTKELAIKDGLTGLYIRRYFIQKLDEEMKRSKELNTPLSYVMIDIDHFKECNDTHGHPFGDKVLRILGEFLKDNLRDVDIIGRYGGEEFAVILPDTNINGARFVSERLREDFSKLVINVNENEGLKLTLSAGGIEYRKGMKLMEVINLADKALYHSKENGRNRVTFWEDIGG